MKNTKKILLTGAISLLGFISCSEDFDSLNVDPKHPTSLPSNNLLATSLASFTKDIYRPNVNYNNYRFFVQHIAETTYTDESNFDLNKRNQPRNTYNGYMARGLNNLELAKEALKNEPGDADVKVNKLATLEIQEIFIWETLVDTYGDLPYSEALKNDILSPKYDDAFTIYKDLIKRIDAVVSTIKISSKGYGADGDFIYNGDMNKWSKFANSIKLRLGINLADFDSNLSKQVVESAVKSGVISNDSESYSMIFDGGTFSNPVYDDFIASGRNDFVPTEGIINLMNEKEDPRRNSLFTQVEVTENGETVKKFIGGVIGEKNTFSTHSHYKDILTNAKAPAKLLSVVEVELILSEAAARGYDVGGTAEEFYNKAVKSSMHEYGITDQEKINNYLNTNAYNSSKWKESIAEQAWVSLFDRAFATWNFNRRLDLNKIVSPTKNELSTNYPYRMPYSDKEYQLNEDNVKAAAKAIGGDKAETKLFWDKN